MINLIYFLFLCIHTRTSHNYPSSNIWIHFQCTSGAVASNILDWIQQFLWDATNSVVEDETRWCLWYHLAVLFAKCKLSSLPCLPNTPSVMLSVQISLAKASSPEFNWKSKINSVRNNATIHLYQIARNMLSISGLLKIYSIPFMSSFFSPLIFNSVCIIAEFRNTDTTLQLTCVCIQNYNISRILFGCVSKATYISTG
jgi:hypothetical protein